MNKKIASEIAVGVILILVIVIGGIFWMQNKNEPVGDASQTTTIVEQNNDNKQNIEEVNVDELIPDTFQILSQNEIKDWKVYTNSKYGYQLKYPDNMECIEDLGVGTIPENQLWCNYDSSDGKNRLYLSIFPHIIIPNQKTITVEPVVGVGATDITVSIKNNDIIGSIYEKLIDVDSFQSKYPFLKKYAVLKNEGFKPFSGVERIIGFSNVLISNTGVLIGRSPGKSTREYERSWFFIKDNVLFQLYAHYDDSLLFDESTDANFIEQIRRIPDLEKIFSTLSFSKASGKYINNYK
jgi:hypothetical protein